MAAEDNTTVKFGEIKEGLVFEGTAASGSPLTTDPISVVLQANESYTIGIAAANYKGSASFNDVNGTLITSDKPVVVNSGTWLGGPAFSTQDIGVDQITPENQAGTEYVLIEGNGGSTAMETPIVIATEEDTDIFVNDSDTPVNTDRLAPGDYIFLDGLYSSAGNMYIQASNPVLVFQTIGGSTNTATPGFNFIPPLGASDARFVNNIPDAPLVGEPTVGIITRTGATPKINGSAPASSPQPVSGTTEWVTYKESDISGDVAVESSKTVAVVLFNVDHFVGAAGYFSGFIRDVDGDGAPEKEDNCPLLANPDQTDGDGDGVGATNFVCHG
jgi:hypothetical protein